MINIETMYDEIIADSYDSDQFQLLTKARDIVLNQIQENNVGNFTSIIDLAVGTGEILLELQKLYPQAKFYGIDISQKMIDIAKSKMEITAFHDDVKNIKNYVDDNSFDLVLIHFILSYVDTEKIIADAASILRQGGICSIATSTYDSFKVMQGLAQNFMAPEDIKSLAKVPENPHALTELLEKAGFAILAKNILAEKVCFANFEELYNWGTKSGWLTQYFTKVTDEQAAMLSTTNGIFPLADEFQGTILLLKKL